MKKKRQQQQKTSPTKELNIVAVKRSPKPVESPQEQSAEVSIEQGVEERVSGVGNEEDRKPTPTTTTNSLETLHTPQAPIPPVQTPCQDISTDEETSCPPTVESVLNAESPLEPIEPTPVDESAHPSSTSTASAPESDASASSAPPSEPEVCFQAVGVIKGDITLSEDRTCVTIGGKQYELYYAGNHKRAYDALKKEIENTGITQQRLIVYPKITHYPGGKQPYRLGFQLVGFVGQEATGEGITSFLQDLEFKISGLWQFIPVCRVPCISVFKNFNKQRLEYIKSAPVDKKVNFMKASHIPVMWRDAPVPPFRFNPKLDKEAQGKASFVQIKAKFNSARDNFEFISLLGIPTEEPPNYLKAGKKDKAEAVRAKRAAKVQEHSSLPIPDKNAAPKRSGATSKPKPKPKVNAVQQQ